MAGILDSEFKEWLSNSVPLEGHTMPNDSVVPPMATVFDGMLVFSFTSSSFGMFKNEYDRGEKFLAAVERVA